MSSKHKTRLKAPRKAKAASASLEQAIALAKAAGASEIVYKGIRVVFKGGEAKSNIKDLKANIKQTAPQNQKAEDLISPESIFDQYTDDEILFWSTEYYDQLEAKKKADKEKQDGNI